MDKVVEQLQKEAEDVRLFLIKTIKKTGGHIASNLGVVELTLALHHCFNSPDDKFVFDVGHQSYVHKMLTGRRDLFKKLRQKDGISGFPKRSESEHDIFDTGHSSTSISAALGFAIAMQKEKSKNKAIAVIGDGSLTGGQAFEALNHAGHIGAKNLIVVLNDNQYSISENVGAFTRYLTKLRTRKSYYALKDTINSNLSKTKAGKKIADFLYSFKQGLRMLVLKTTYFETMGFKYIGPIDGHNLKDLIYVFNRCKDINSPVLVHVVTKKGKGYKPAEDDPSLFHGIGKGGSHDEGISSSEAVGDKLLELAKKDEKVIAMTAAMCEGTGLKKYAKELPQQYMDVGICEQHAVTLAGSLSLAGQKPFCIIYSSFMQRAYDQLLHDIALQNIPAVFLLDRAGVVGEDGETHHGLFDLSYLQTLPNFEIIAPSSICELQEAIKYAYENNTHPIAIRYPKKLPQGESGTFEFGKIRLVKKSKSNKVIIAVGDMLEDVKNAKATILSLTTVSPLDIETIKKYVDSEIIIYENNVIAGGIGEKIKAMLPNANITLKGYDKDNIPKQATTKEQKQEIIEES